MGKALAATNAAAQPDDPNAPPKVVSIRAEADPRREYVVSGLPFWGGAAVRALPWSADELTVQFGPDLFDRMLFDDEVHAAVLTLVTAVLADGVEIVPAVDDKLHPDYARAADIAAFCRRSWEGAATPMDDVLQAMVTAALVDGHKVAERVLRWGDGEDAGRIVLDKVKVKSRYATAFVVDPYMNVLGLLALKAGQGPAMIDPLVTGLGGGVVDAQGNPTEVPTNLLPRDHFAVLTIRAKDHDPRGTSLLRPAFRPWWKKVQADPEHMKWVAQFASPGLVGTTSEDAQPQPLKNADGTPVVDAQGNPVYLYPEQAMVDTLVAFRNGTAMAFPFGSTVTPIETKDDGSQFIAFQADQNRAIAKAILHQTLATGEAQHESRAAAGIHQDILGQLVRQIKRVVARMIVRDILAALTVANFGDDARSLTPQVSLGDTNEEDKTARMTAYAAWKREGMLLPSQYPDVYAEVGAPPASPEDLALVAERWQSASTLPEGTTNVSVQAQAAPDGTPPPDATPSGEQPAGNEPPTDQPPPQRGR